VEAYRIDRFGSVDGIVLRSSEDPRPGPREILMRVRARSLNYRDLMVLKGRRSRSHEARCCAASDGAGEVAAIGEGVTRVKVGERIAGTFIRAGLADRSGRNTSPIGLAPILTGCWRNTPC
jgi:NADPH:quinone reductase-like Zn-dependent oxidoreductase